MDEISDQFRLTNKSCFLGSSTDFSKSKNLKWNKEIKKSIITQIVNYILVKQLREAKKIKNSRLFKVILYRSRFFDSLHVNIPYELNLKSYVDFKYLVNQMGRKDWLFLIKSKYFDRINKIVITKSNPFVNFYAFYDNVLASNTWENIYSVSVCDMNLEDKSLNLEDEEEEEEYTQGTHVEYAKKLSIYIPNFSNVTELKTSFDDLLFLSAKSIDIKKLESLTIIPEKYNNILLETYLSNLDLKSLKKLSMKGVSMSSLAYLSLSSNESISDLESMDFSSNNLNIVSLRHLGRVEWRRIVKLNLMNSGLFLVDSIRAIAESNCFRKLQDLNLSFNYFGELGARILSKNTTWTEMERLNIRGNLIGEAGARELIKNKSWRNLKFIDISLNGIGDEVEAIIGKNKIWILNNANFDDNSEHLTELEIKSILKSKESDCFD